MIENIDILMTALSTLTGAGGLGGILIWRHNRKMREMDRKLREAEVAKANIQAKADEFHFWKDQCESFSQLNKTLTDRNHELVGMMAEKENRHQAEMQRKEERHAEEMRKKEDAFREQTLFLRGVQKDYAASNERVTELTRQKAELQVERDHYELWKCFREDDGSCEGCDRRKPRQPVPVKYIPLNPPAQPAPACE